MAANTYTIATILGISNKLCDVCRTSHPSRRKTEAEFVIKGLQGPKSLGFIDYYVCTDCLAKAALNKIKLDGCYCTDCLTKISVLDYESWDKHGLCSGCGGFHDG